MGVDPKISVVGSPAGSPTGRHLLAAAWELPLQNRRQGKMQCNSVSEQPGIQAAQP
jgi:hypothetical protein